MTRTRTSVLGATFFLLAGALALALVLFAGRSSGGNQLQLKVGAGAVGVTSKEAKFGEGRAGGFEAYRSAAADVSGQRDPAGDRSPRGGHVQPDREA